MEEAWPLDYPVDFPFQNENEISKHVEMPVATIIHNLDEHYVSKLLSNINFDTVQDLFLCSKKLIDLPEDFGFHFVNLRRLDLSENQLSTVPHSLKFILNLKNLFLNRNCIHYLPLTITEITSLTELNLSHNSMTSLPDSIANLGSLQVLNLAHNNLSELPLVCQQMNNLNILNLTGNRLTRMPQCIVAGMTSLQMLYLSENSSIDLSDKPASKKLVAFHAREAGRNVKFPTWILTGHAPCLEILDFDGTRFDAFEFPKECTNLNIQIFSIQNCCIYGIQLEKILSLTKELSVLRVANRKWSNKYKGYWHFPFEELEFPEKLMEIDLRCTRLSFIPEDIENFVHLVKIDLGNNVLRWLPDEICKLQALKILNIDNNFLSALPNDLGNLTSLTELKAHTNRITSLPDSSRKLKNLTFLDLYGNAFTCVPKTLSSMDNLKAFDIDLNPLYISDLWINGTKYETFRQTLRQRCSAFDREMGARYDTDFDESSEMSSETSSTGSCESHPKVVENLNNKSQENWDISDDSADDYDPTCDDGKTTRKKWTNFFYTATHQTLFCPANLHPMTIRQQIVQLKEEGLFREYAEAEVEGQFEDA